MAAILSSLSLSLSLSLTRFTEDDVLTVSENEEGAVGGAEGEESKQSHQSDSTSDHDVENSKKSVHPLPQCLICMVSHQDHRCTKVVQPSSVMGSIFKISIIITLGSVYAWPYC